MKSYVIKIYKKHRDVTVVTFLNSNKSRYHRVGQILTRSKSDDMIIMYERTYFDIYLNDVFDYVSKNV